MKTPKEMQSALEQAASDLTDAIDSEANPGMAIARGLRTMLYVMAAQAELAAQFAEARKKAGARLWTPPQPQGGPS